MPVYRDEEVQQLNMIAEATRKKLGDNPVNLRRHAWSFSLQERQHNVNADSLYNRLDRLGMTTRRKPDGSYYIFQDAISDQQMEAV